MKILYLFRSLAVWGGIERILVDKMNWLVSENNTEVFLLTTDQGEHPIVYSLNERVHFEDLNINFYRRYQYSVRNTNAFCQIAFILFDLISSFVPQLIR